MVRFFYSQIFLLSMASVIVPHRLPVEETLSIDRFRIASLDKVVPPGKTLWTLDYTFEGRLSDSSFLSGLRVSTVGEPSNIEDILFLFHGDKPSYYDSSTRAGKSTTPIEAELIMLHRALVREGAGLLIVQPLCSVEDWHSLYRSGSEDSRASELAHELQNLYRTFCQQLQRNCGLHLHSFSGAGRVDRALHNAMREKSETFSLLRSGILRSWTVSDGMVNNAYSRDDKLEHASIMAVSWARFIQKNPTVPVTLIYDRSGEYPYMQGINLDVIRFTRALRKSGSINIKPSVRIVENSGIYRTVMDDRESVLTQLKEEEGKQDVAILTSSAGHLETLLGRIAESFLGHRMRRGE